MGINFAGYNFSNPTSIAYWIAPYIAGIYGILVPDQLSTPQPYRVIYFGESSNMSERGFLTSHHKYDCWILQAGSEGNLYISVYEMPGSTLEQRRAVESLLITTYNPICNQL